MSDDTSNAFSDQQAAASAVSQPLVLVVDDDKLVHKLVHKILERGDFAYEGVNSAQEALDHLTDHAPDLILCDIMMPGMNGIEFCSELRKIEKYKDLPVIFFTGLSDMDTLSRAYAAGGTDYVVKPIRQAEVLSRAARHIAEYRKVQESKKKILTLNKQNESKTKFLGVASHDLRNPLVSIRGISQYLESEKFGPLNPDQKELIATVIQASEAMLTLVEDLLDVSKFDSDQIQINPAYESLQGLAESAVTLHSATAEKKQMKLECVVERAGSMVFADRKLISRVIDNLTSNAMKFSAPGTKVQLVIDGDDDRVSLSFLDQGPGIPEAEFNKLFKEFGRTSNQPTAGESSSGIGLFVSKRIIAAHGGEITVENRDEGGANFTFILQRAKQS